MAQCEKFLFNLNCIYVTWHTSVVKGFQAIKTEQIGRSHVAQKTLALILYSNKQQCVVFPKYDSKIK